MPTQNTTKSRHGSKGEAEVRHAVPPRKPRRTTESPRRKAATLGPSKHATKPTDRRPPWSQGDSTRKAARASFQRRMAYQKQVADTIWKDTPRRARAKRNGPYTGPRQPHTPRQRPSKAYMPGPGDYNPKISAVGPNFVSSVASSPGFTFGDPTISTRDKLQRELDLRDGLVPETEQQVARGLAMQAVLARPKSPRLSPRFASDTLSMLVDETPGPGSYSHDAPIAGRAPPGVSFGSASRTGPGSYAWDEAFADSNHRRALDDAIEADTLRTNRAIVAVRFGRTPGYNAALAGMDKAGHRAVTAEEAVRANVDPRALLLQPALRREVIAQKAREKKASIGSPGPGAYEPVDEIAGSPVTKPAPTGGRFGIAERTLKTSLVDDKQPGPAAYNISSWGGTGGTQINSKMTNHPGVRFGADKRPGGFDEWNSAPELTGPGPGAYHVDAAPLSTIAQHDGYTIGAGRRANDRIHLPHLR